MSISYRKLRTLLAEKNMQKMDLVHGAGIGTKTLAKLSKDEPVTLEALEKIASYLRCDIGDISEFIKNGRSKIKALSLFANVGIAESYFDEIGIEVVIANELVPQRAKFYSHLYPKTDMIIGDITEQAVIDELVMKSIKKGINLIMATPPCQGMSTAGKQDTDDPRNSLISYAVEIIKKVRPAYVFLENVPELLLTYINYNGDTIRIPQYLEEELGGTYDFNSHNVVDAANYGVPQTRERAIFLLTRKDISKKWEIPIKDAKKITLEDVIGKLPIVDPLVYDVPYDEHIKLFPNYEHRAKKALEFSKWHVPPRHVYRQVFAMMHTPSGKTAFDNKEEFRPKKTDGTDVKGFRNTYKRQEWEKPAFTVTMFNRTIGSQNNVHPGRLVGLDENGDPIYSDPRVLTIYEIMLVMSLPNDWNIPNWASDNFIRSVIGEGIPPVMVKKIMQEITK